MDSLTFSLEEYEAFHHDKDVKLGCNINIFRNHMCSYGNVKEYVEFKIMQVDKDYKRIYEEHRRAVRADENDIDYWENLRESTEEYNFIVPKDLIMEVKSQLQNERKERVRHPKPKPVIEVVKPKPKPKKVEEDSSSDVEAEW